MAKNYNLDVNCVKDVGYHACFIFSIFIIFYVIYSILLVPDDYTKFWNFNVSCSLYRV